MESTGVLIPDARHRALIGDASRVVDIPGQCRIGGRIVYKNVYGGWVGTRGVNGDGKSGEAAISLRAWSSNSCFACGLRGNASKERGPSVTNMPSPRF
jgi:hypothetical protein